MKNMRTYLVTGATGLIGWNIVQQLLRRGETVRALVRSPARAQRVLPAACQLVPGDVTDLHSVRAAVKGCQVVYHAAGLPEQWLPDKRIFEFVNAGGTRNVVQASLEEKIEKLIHLSTVDIFVCGKDKRCDETSLDPNPRPSCYGRSKQQADQVVAAALEKGLPAIFIHPAGVYGPGPNSSQWFFEFIRQVLNRKIPCVPPGSVPLVFSEDVACGCLLAEQHAPVGGRYILSESSEGLRAMAGTVARELGFELDPKILPLWFARALAQGGALLSKLSHKPPLLHREILEFFQLNMQPSSGRARGELGWTARSFRAGVRKTVEFMLEKGLIRLAGKRVFAAKTGCGVKSRV